MKKLSFFLALGLAFLSCGKTETTTPSTTATITLSTRQLTLMPGNSIVLRATVSGVSDTTVTWRCEPTGSGTLVAAGVNTVIFTAPTTSGTVKVIARANGDAASEATITVTVTTAPPATKVLYNNGNVAGVSSGPTAPTTFTAPKDVLVVYANTYHYFNHGVLPGTIAFKHSDGTIYGPWLCVGTVGQGGVANAYWVCYPYVTIKAGTYTVIDSDPSTWSHNAGSGYAGFTYVSILDQ